ncbi:MAG: CBS domain-containing protein [Desulfobacteraceae bacterium]|nr:CBS domain-containing protein [Desulfobacteraceae bacterium]
MKIKSLMISNPITIPKNASVAEALELMKNNSIRHLPVVNSNKSLLGFVTLADLKQGLIPSMVGDLLLKDIMIQNPITVGSEDDIELAARLIYLKKISGMPVVEQNQVIGIITESDILRAFIDMMGILSSSSRIDAVLGDDPAALNKALQTITDSGGQIINVGMTAQNAGKKTYFFRLAACDTTIIRKALENKGVVVLSAMD